MKQRETIEAASRLTWDNVAATLRDGAPDGFTTMELAELYEVDYTATRNLLRLMYDAGVCARVVTGKTGGTTLYFHRG